MVKTGKGKLQKKVPVMIDPSVSLVNVAVADFHSSSLEVTLDISSRMI